MLSILDNRFPVQWYVLEMVPFLPHRSHADIHCWLNFYISSPPCFRRSTRFRSGSSWIHRIHTETTTNIFSNQHTLYHLFADDTQGYDRCYVTDVPVLLSRLSACVNDLNSLYSSLCLQLNPAKTEFIWFGSWSNLAKISAEYRSLTVASSSIHCAHAVRNLGVTFGSELSMNSHISKTANSCFFHLRRLWQLRGVVTDGVMKQLVTSLVLSRLDYCNYVLFGLPASTLAPLQRVQNVAARLVLRLDHRAHIKPALQRLHWLPVKARIQFKIATMMHATLNQRGPAYLNNIIKFNREESGCCHLRSSTTNAAVVMRTRT